MAIPQKKYIPLLIDTLDDSSHFIREVITKELGEIGQTMEDGELKTSIIKALEAKLSDTYTLKSTLPRICDYAAQALEKIGTEQALDIVNRWHQTEQKF